MPEPIGEFTPEEVFNEEDFYVPEDPTPEELVPVELPYEEILDFTARVVPYSQGVVEEVESLTDITPEMQDLLDQIAELRRQLESVQSYVGATEENSAVSDATVAEIFDTAWTASQDLQQTTADLSDLADQTNTIREDLTAASGYASDAALAAANAHNEAVEAEQKAEAARLAAIEAEKAAAAAEASAAAAIKGSVVQYAVGSSETVAPTTGWSASTPTRTAGTFIWMRTIITYGNNDTSTSSPALLTGPAGAGGSGATGVSVIKISTFFHQRLTSQGPPPPPTGNGTPGGWSETEPSYTALTTLYRSERVDYSAGNSTWTAPTPVTAYAVAGEAMASANGKNTRNTSLLPTLVPANPLAPPTATTNLNGRALVEGDTWWRVNNWTERVVTGQWTWTVTSGVGAWKADTIGTEVIANLDVSKLTVTGNASMQQATVEKMAVDFGTFKVLTADKLAILSSDSGMYMDPTFLDPGLSSLRASNNGNVTYSPTTKTFTSGSDLFLTQRGEAEGNTIPLLVGDKYSARAWGTNLFAGVRTFAYRTSTGSLVNIPTSYSSGMMSALYTPTTAGTQLLIRRVAGASTSVIDRLELRKGIGGVLIEDGTVTADAFSVGAITADKISVVSRDGGIYPDPNFVDPGLSKLRADNTPGVTYTVGSGKLSGTGNPWLTLQGLDEGKTVPLNAGDRYTIRVFGTGLTAANGRLFAIRDVNGYSAAPPASMSYFPGGMQYTFSVGAAEARIQVYRSGTSGTASMTLDRVEIRQGIGGTLIDNNSISTEHINTSSVFADMQLTSPLIQTSTVYNVGIKIDGRGSANSFTAYGTGGLKLIELNGSTGAIRGSLFETDAGSTTGIKIDGRGSTNSFTAYGPGGVKTIEINGSTGSIRGLDIEGSTIKGNSSVVGGSVSGAIVEGGIVRSGPTTSARVQIYNEGSGGILQTVSSANRELVRLGVSTTPGLGDELTFREDSANASVNTRLCARRLTMYDSNGYMTTSLVGGGEGSDALLSAQGNLSVSATNILGLSATGQVHATVGSQFRIMTTDSSSDRNSWWFRNAMFGGTNHNALQFQGGGALMPQTGSAANVHMDVNGYFYRLSSARRFKEDIQEARVDPYAVLDVKLRDWIDKAKLTDNPDFSERTFGVIAEELEEIGLDPLVTYELDGRPSGVMYDRIALLLIPIVKELRAKVNRLETR